MLGNWIGKMLFAERDTAKILPPRCKRAPNNNQLPPQTRAVLSRNVFKMLELIHEGNNVVLVSLYHGETTYPSTLLQGKLQIQLQRQYHDLEEMGVKDGKRK